MFVVAISYGQKKSKTDQSRDSLLAVREHLFDMLDKSFQLYDQGNFRESLENNLKTIKLAEQYNDYEVAHQSYSYLGYDYLILEDTVRALESFKKSHFYARKTKDPILLADAYTDYAQVYAHNNDTYEKGMHYFKNALLIYHKLNDSLGLQGSYYDYAQVLFKRRDQVNLPIILDSLIRYTEIANLEPRHKAMTYNLQAEIFLRDKKLAKAEDILLKSIAITEKGGQLELLEESYKLYSLVLREKKDFGSAYEMLFKYDSLNQINQKRRNYLESKRVAARFQIDEKQKEIRQAQLETELAQKSVERRTLINYLLAVIILLGWVSIIFLIYTSRRRKAFIKSLEQKNKLVEKAKRETEKLARVKSSFFSTVSHELRTPLYGVIGLSSILLEKNKDEENLQDLKSLKFSADYLLALVNDVLLLNKIDSTKKIDNHNDLFNLIELVENITSTFEYLRVQNNNTIKTLFDDNLPYLIEGNSTQLSQILMNLIGNACKFTENGLICIELKTIVKGQQCTVQFSVADTGLGIAKNKIKEMFDEFTQGEAKNNTYQGTGLGLTIVKKLLQTAGSEISVKSELGKGSRFTFELTYNVIQDKITSRPKSLKKIHDPKGLHGRQVLVVEDNKINQMVTKKILEKDGVICDMAENGKIALNMVRTANYDLILMDVNMPVMDGIEATREIRKFSTIPIIALTAVELEEMRAKIMDSGMNDIIVKPYDLIQFQQTLLSTIERSKKEKAC